MRIKDGCERAAAENVAACGCAVEPRQTSQDSRLAHKASIPAVDVPDRRERSYKRYIYTYSQVKSSQVKSSQVKFFFIYGGYIHAEECTVQDSTVIINE